MQPEEVLPTIAEIAITVAGFASVLVAMGVPAEKTPSGGQYSRLAAVVIIPAISFVCALLPFALSDFSNSPSVIWGISLCTYAILTSLMIVRSIWQVRRGQLRLSTPGLGYAVMATSTGVVLLTLLSGVGLVLPFSPGVLVLSLIWSLLGAGYALVAAVALAVLPPAA